MRPSMRMQKTIKYAIFGVVLATMSAGCSSTKNDTPPENDSDKLQAVIIQDDADILKKDIEQPQEPKDSKIIVKYEVVPYTAPDRRGSSSPMTAPRSVKTILHRL